MKKRHLLFIRSDTCWRRHNWLPIVLIISLLFPALHTQITYASTCLAGTYIDGDGCTPCPPGTYQDLPDQSTCIPADPDHFVASEGTTTQTPCGFGTYQPDKGAVACILAPPGTFVDTMGSVAPIPCPAGRYQPEAGQDFCIPADPGHYVPHEGATEQTPCSADSVQPDFGGILCQPCPAGSQPNSEHTQCVIVDGDGDGVSDNDDACPEENAAGMDANGDGCIDEIGDVAAVVEALDLAGSLEKSLLSKIDAAENSLSLGNTQAAINQPEAFINQVEAQRGKKIAVVNADMLVAFVQNVIGQLTH